MQTSYHVTGLVSSLIFLLTLSGLWSQLTFIWNRKRQRRESTLLEGTTEVLSLNQFLSSFFAFFSLFLYGSSFRPINPYLVWPRMVACLMVLIILFEIARDRRDALSLIGCAGCLLLFATGIVLISQSLAFTAALQRMAQGVVVIVTVILGQGYLHQVFVIRDSGRTGAVSIRLHQFFLLKDISTVLFGWTMGWQTGWPVMLISSVSGITKVITLWHFRWVRFSPRAARQRARGESRALGMEHPPRLEPL